VRGAVSGGSRRLFVVRSAQQPGCELDGVCAVRYQPPFDHVHEPGLLPRRTPGPGWRPVDSFYDVIIHPPDLPGATLHVSKGLFPTDPSGSFVETQISQTQVVAALRRMSALQVSRPVLDHIGDGLAAARVDIRLSPSAPAAGFDYLTYKSQNGTGTGFAIKKGMVVRVYAAVYRAPYGHELLNIAVEAPTAKVFARWTAEAGQVLQTLRLPQGLVPARTFRHVWK
jgi:hypothetical protein